MTTSNDLSKHVEPFVLAALLECTSPDEYRNILKTSSLERLCAKISGDLLSFARKDPASRQDPLFILQTYTSFSAVLHYRISRWVLGLGSLDKRRRHDTTLPALLSRRGKILSGAEIHFRSDIGERFVLDHGFGTVIGETSVIGNDCYILGGVTLGARGISQNPNAPRHPVIGDRVQIGAFSSILGPVHIGNDVFIGAHCIITQDIASGSRVKIESRIQVTS